ncbi:MAG TPA: DUF5996 family protein [Gammaproteobacteria bacterium]|nr:DUF5996 family protein [Gammaproteobacteria bacterium]
MTQALDWKPIGKVKPEKLTSTRRTLHLAAQAVANLGRSYLPAPEDYGNISLRWIPKFNGLAGQPVPAGTSQLLAALSFDPLEWLLLDAKAATLAKVPLAGKTLAQLESAVRAELKRHGLDETRYTVKPPFQVEATPLLEGGNFSPEWDVDERRELAAYYTGADMVLRALAAEFPGASGPRCWPHHFDYALLMKLDAGSHENARSVGLGMSPGDQYYDQPYFYSTPWPYPTGPLPPLPKPASWHTQEWTGAVLRASALPPMAGTALAAYWRAAYTLLRGLLEKPPA